MHKDTFVQTLRDLEGTLNAGHIASSPVWCCSTSDDVLTLRQLVSPAAKDFTFVPARADSGDIVGVVHRHDLVGKRGSVGDQVKVLARGQTIEFNRELTPTIEALEKHEFLLVRPPGSALRESSAGIITRADVQKTPVRLLLFARLIEIEVCLRQIIGGTNWHHQAECARELGHAERTRKKFKQDQLPLEDYLNVKDLLKVARRTGVPLLPDLDDHELEQHAEKVRRARNQVCHGHDVGGGSGPVATVEQLRKAFDIIEKTMSSVASLRRTRRRG